MRSFENVPTARHRLWFVNSGKVSLWTDLRFCFPVFVVLLSLLLWRGNKHLYLWLHNTDRPLKIVRVVMQAVVVRLVLILLLNLIIDASKGWSHLHWRYPTMISQWRINKYKSCCPLLTINVNGFVVSAAFTNIKVITVILINDAIVSFSIWHLIKYFYFASKKKQWSMLTTFVFFNMTHIIKLVILFAFISI